MPRFMLEGHDRVQSCFPPCMNYVIKTFLLVSSSVRSKQILCFVQDKIDEGKEFSKEFIGFNFNNTKLDC